MSIDKEPVVIVEGMNIFCPEGRLCLPANTDPSKDDSEIMQAEPEVDSLSDTEKAWIAVEALKADLQEHTNNLGRKKIS